MQGDNNPRFGKPKPVGAGNGLPAQQISVLDVNTNESTTYDSIRAAARALNIHPSVIDLYFIRNQVESLQRSLYF